MVEHIRVRRRFFIKIAVIVAVMFAAGLALGFVFDSFRTAFLNEEMITANVDTESFVVSQAYIANNPDYCKLIPPYLEKISENVEQLGKDLSALGSKMIFVNSTFMDRRYFLYEIRLWMTVEEYKVRCNASIDTILFFYGDDSDASYRQGLVLTALKEELKEKVMIFSFMHKFKEPALKLVEENYNVTQIPTIVVNGKVYREFVEKNDLEAMLSA